MELSWARQEAGGIPRWELDADPGYVVEKWGIGAYAWYHQGVRQTGPAGVSTRGEAQDLAEARYRASRPEPDTAGYRVRLSPVLSVILDASQCIVLEVAHPQTGIVLQRADVPDVAALKAALDGAKAEQAAEMERADQRRVAGRDQRAKAEGQLNRREAVDDLVANGYTRGHGVNLTRRAMNGEPGDPGDPVHVTHLPGGYFTVAYNPAPRIPVADEEP